MAELAGTPRGQHGAGAGDDGNGGRYAERDPAGHPGIPRHRGDDEECGREQEKVVKNEPGAEPHNVSTSIALLLRSTYRCVGGS